MFRTLTASMVLLLACNGGKDTDTGSQLDDCPDVPSMLEEKCTLCHGSDQPSGDLDMQTAGWDTRISGRSGNTCAGVLADPARPSESLLYLSLFEEPACGSQMPLGGDPLTESERLCVRDWIAGLAPPIDDTDDDCPDCECEPDETEDCYTGPSGTMDVGICEGGVRTCDPEGFWGSCEQQVLPRAEDCRTTSVDENCDGETPECSDRWLGVFGGDGSQVFRSVAVDSQGNVAILGDFAGSVAFGGDVLRAVGEKQDYVLLKMDSTGNVLWSKRFGDSSNQWATQVTIAPNDDIVVAGRAFGTIDFGGEVLDAVGTDDIVVARFDTDGDHLWSTMVGGLDPDRTESVMVADDGDVIISGAFTGTASFGTGSLTSRGFRDAFVLRIDGTSGRSEWVVQLGGPADDHGFAVSKGPGGSIIAGGRYGGVAMFGSQELTSNGGQDVFVTELSSSGVIRWAKGFGGAGVERLDALVADPSTGQITLAGYTDGAVDFGGGALTTAGDRDIWVAGLDSDGGYRWSSIHGDAADQFNPTYDTSAWLNLALHPTGGVVLGGLVQGTVSFNGPTIGSAGKSDFLAVHFGADGSYLAGRTWGSSGTELLHDIDVAPDGDIVFVGRFWSGPVDFGEVGVARDLGSNSEALVVKLGLP